MCSTNWATTAYFIFGRMMGVEPMTKGVTILYSTNWATISIFVPSKESNLHTYNVYHCIFYLEFIMIRYHQDANYRSVAVTNIRTKPAFLWEGWDSDPLRFLCTGFTAQRPTTIWAALPLFRLGGTTRTCARHYSMLRFPKPARFTNSSTPRL